MVHVLLVDSGEQFGDREAVLSRLDERWSPTVLDEATWGTDARAVEGGRAMMEFVGSPDPLVLEQLAKERASRDDHR